MLMLKKHEICPKLCIKMYNFQIIYPSLPWLTKSMKNRRTPYSTPAKPQEMFPAVFTAAPITYKDEVASQKFQSSTRVQMENQPLKRSPTLVRCPRMRCSLGEFRNTKVCDLNWLSAFSHNTRLWDTPQKISNL